jgi:hypothetical protein
MTNVIRTICALMCLAIVSISASGADAPAAPKPASDLVTLRIRFGMKDTDNTDWSGTLALSSGKIESIRGWRWMPGDKAEGNAFTVMTRRQVAQSEAERKRVQAGGKLPIKENGIIVTLSGVTLETQVSLDTKPGKASFKIAELPVGARLSKLDDNLQVERVPVVTPLAESAADEDYPAVATAKDGTVYLVYLAFTRGKDFQGKRERPASAESGPVVGPLAAGEVRKIEKPADFDYLAEPTGGEQLYLRIRRPDGSWGKPIAVTDGKQELYRATVAVDGSGRPWIFYSAHVGPDATLDHGNWELMARSFAADGSGGSAVVNISNAPGTDFMPAAATDSDGKVWVTWVGGREGHFNVFVAHQDDDGFSAPQRLTDAAVNEWEPAIAADSKGHLAVAWDTYAKGDYDVYVARRTPDGKFEKPQAVAATLAFEVRPSMAYDPQGQLWIAYEQSGDQWGKDFGALKKKGIPLYQAGRTLGIKVLRDDGQWFAPPNVMLAMPTPAGKPANRATVGPLIKTNIAPNYPRLVIDTAGDVYLSFRGKPGGNWRVGVGSVWFEYVTRCSADAWSPAAWIPRSNNVLDNRPALLTDAHGGLALAFSGDGRGELNPPKLVDPEAPEAQVDPAAFADSVATDEDDPEVPVIDDAAGAAPGAAATPQQPAAPARRPGAGARRGGAWQPDPNEDLFLAYVRADDFGPGASRGAPQLKPIPAEQPVPPAPDVEAERRAIAAMRDYHITLNGQNLRLWRGEFHRHTEFSPDGAGDGGLLDLWRYAIDSAGLDWIGDGDHDYGNGREYSWWTTQKAVTLFTLPDHFVPMYCYERSVVYPEGHRNCLFAKRGIRSLPRLPLSSADKFAPAPDTNLLYMYLRHFDGVCAPHTSATNMGTDWRNHDPEVEPFVEIYQGDRNSYERPDAPRSAVTEAKLKQSTPEKEALGGWRPKGFVNLALLKGYRFAFEASSDHISTHLSYCNVFVTEPTREAVLEAVRKRRVYGSTDNIIADVRCKAGNVEHFMGEEFDTKEAPTLSIHIVGAQKIAKVTIIKDDEEVHVIQPNTQDVTFTWTDPRPTAGKTSYYYVRGEQVPDMDGVSSGELVWASPMWIKYEAPR